MASIYKRPDSGTYWLSSYPHKGGKLVRVSLGTSDAEQAELVRRKAELLEQVERLGEVQIPEELIRWFTPLSPTHKPTAALLQPNQASGLTQQLSQPGTDNVPSPMIIDPRLSAPGTAGLQEVKIPNGDLRTALRRYLARSIVGNVPSTLNDKIHRFRKFFGSELIDEIDPRPLERRMRARGEFVPPFCSVTTLSDITTDTLIEFLGSKSYSKSSKRHYREVFHGLFKHALISGVYRPDNPYAANPADELPGFSGRENEVTILTAQQIHEQYRVAAPNPVVLFGCRLMIEAGLRCHEVLALRPRSFSEDFSQIRLTMPPRTGMQTGLKTGERPVTVREALRPHIPEYLSRVQTEWLFTAPRGDRMSTNIFGDALRELNRPAGLPWTTQDFRHTYATDRIREGWNLKTLADEMGTSIAMLMEFYAGYIAPPVQAALSAALGSS